MRRGNATLNVLRSRGALCAPDSGRSKIAPTVDAYDQKPKSFLHLNSITLDLPMKITPLKFNCFRSFRNIPVILF